MCKLSDFKFKKLTADSRKEVTDFTKRFDPYSDFNFTSMYVYDVADDLEYCLCNDCLIVKFTDYESSDKFYSVLGSGVDEEFLNSLILFGAENLKSPYLKLVPESVASGILNSSKFLVIEDVSNFDYVLDLADLYDSSDSGHKTVRNMSTRFLKDYPSSVVREINLLNKKTLKQVKNIIDRWADEKELTAEKKSAFHEFTALDRFLNLVSSGDEFIVHGLYSGSELLAFSVNEKIDSRTVIAHFRKGIREIPGIFYYFEREVAGELIKMGYKTLNFEQDLGIEGLHHYKKALSPIKFLKKYTVSLK